MDKIRKVIIQMAESLHRRKNVVLALSCLVVFITSYMLILPGFTLDKDQAVRQGGIDIDTTAAEISDEDDAAETGDTGENNSSADMESEDETYVYDSGEDFEASSDEDAEEPATSSETLTYEGDGYTITVEDPAGVLPENTTVVVNELLEKPEEGTKAERKAAEEEYKAYYDKALEAVNEDADGDKDISFVRFYDITLQADGEEIRPDEPVNVTISYDEKQQSELKVDEKRDVRVVHFDEEEKTGEITAEILDDENVDVTLDKEKMAEATFEAGSFSVYGIMYTVDFHYDVDGETYEYSIPGGSAETLSGLADQLGLITNAKKQGTVGEEFGTAAFMAAVTDVKFSAPELICVSRTDKDTTIGNIRKNLKLKSEYSKTLTTDQLSGIDATKVSAGDWALISLKPFTGTETLTITMNNGETFEVRVTDAQGNGNNHQILWKEYNDWDDLTINVHYAAGDTSLDDSIEPYTLSMEDGDWIDFADTDSFPAKYKDIDGYTLKNITYNGRPITKIEVQVDKDSYNLPVSYKVHFYEGTHEVTQVDLDEGETILDIHFNYEKKTDPSGGEIDPPDFDDLPKAEGSKTLTPNNDGTYTLTLSMEVPKLETQKSNKANVVIIFDSSNSMHEPIPGNTWVRDDEHGTYAEYNGKYYQLVGIGSDIRKVYKFTDDQGVDHILGTDQKNNGIFCGPKYLPTNTRLHEAKRAVNFLADTLLANNTAEDPSKVELAFVEFASDVLQVQQPTTDRSTVTSWIDSCKTPIERTQNGASLMGGTNWDAALRVASGKAYEGHEDVVSFNDDDQLYIIFVSDGNPTARTTEEGDDGPRIGSNIIDTEKPGVYGTGNSDTQGYNFNCAQRQATQIVNVDKTLLYNIGIYGDADRMQELTNTGYFEGTDEASMKKAFSQIVGSISSKLGYTNLSILDGITSMTSTTLVHGDPKDFTYKVTRKDENGNVVDVTDEVLKEPFEKAVYHSGDDPSTTAKESGYVTWNLGAKDLLLDGGTYSVSFIVWPDQDAYDLVSDLNNGIREWSDLNEIEKSQVVGSGNNNDQAPYSLRTNTQQSIKYSTARAVTDSSGDLKVYYGDPGEATLQTPEPMPLTDSKIKVQKVWEHDLDSEQYEDFVNAHKNDDPPYSIDLTLKREGSAYIDGIQVGIPDPVKDTWPENQQAQDGHTWPDIEQGTVWHHISAGLMVSFEAAQRSGLRVVDDEGAPIYKTSTYEGKTYYILETGHDYTITENLDDHHFEQEDKVWHPMVVDGELKNVTFEELDSDTPVVKDIEDGKTFSLKNQLKGGIRIYKDVYEKTGTTKINATDRGKFPITIALTAADGSAYNASSDEGGYRINYTTSNRPESEKEYGEEGTEEYLKNKQKNRSVRYDITDGTFTVDLYAGEFIQVANVDRGTHYTITEANCPSGYESMAIVYDPVNTIVESNSEHNVYVKNKKLQPSGSLKIDKQVRIGNTPASEITDSRKDLADGVYTFNVFTDRGCTAPAAQNNGDSVGDVTVTIRNGVSVQAAEVTDLTPGKYYVKEISGNNTNVQLDTNIYEVTVSDGESGASVSAAATATATNTLPVGSLKVTKEIASTSGEALSGTYTYPVVIRIHANNKDYYVQNAEGVLGEQPPDASLTVTNGTALTISNLPYGAYAVVESNPGDVEIHGYSYVVTDGSISSADVTVSSQAGTAELKNYYMSGAHWTPEVTKLVNGEAYHGTEYSFHLQQRSGKGSYSADATTRTEDGKAVFDTIDYDPRDFTGNDETFIYEITENRANPIDNVQYDTRTIYAKVVVTKTSGKVLTATGAYYSDAECTKPIEGEPIFDNTELASLSVKKTVTGDYSPSDSDAYPIAIMKGDLYLNSVKELVETDPGLTIKADQKLIFEGIPVGDYRVVEGNVDSGDYSLTTTYKVNNGTAASGSAEASTEKGKNTEVEIINNYSSSTCNISIIKVDETTRNGDAESLAGAKFRLYQLTTPSGGSQASYTEYPNSTDCEKVTNEDGWLGYIDLPHGRYKLVEIDAPKGYVLEEDLEIYFTVNGSGVTWTDSTGQEIDHQDMVGFDTENSTFTVGNTPGVELPHTGGIGMTLFYILGSILAIGCGVLLAARKHMTL